MKRRVAYVSEDLGTHFEAVHLPLNGKTKSKSMSCSDTHKQNRKQTGNAVFPAKIKKIIAHKRRYAFCKGTNDASTRLSVVMLEIVFIRSLFHSHLLRTLVQKKHTGKGSSHSVVCVA